MPNKSLLISWREKWNRSLLQFLGRRVQSSVDIQDLAQETYMRLLRARDLQDVRNPQAYLLQVASHVVLEWRKNRSYLEMVSGSEQAELIDDCPPELDIDAAISQKRLEEALKTMSATMRAVVLLRLRDDRALKDIAQDLNLTLRQVRRYLARGYVRLHQVLED